ncbi:hypothetical protein OUZ56_032506 [Daphnia magna]|uniref:Uncharacterized protein n=1 Tax=Daphnia magna TaxID=35525 RepID=A0ABR0B947_9CRUS|nr:hypothetical protein OUZ56_032506 [Daphnia magna]
MALLGAACSDSSSPSPADAGEADAAMDGATDSGPTATCAAVGEACAGRSCCGEMKDAGRDVPLAAAAEGSLSPRSSPRVPPGAWGFLFPATSAKNAPPRKIPLNGKGTFGVVSRMATKKKAANVPSENARLEALRPALDAIPADALKSPLGPLMTMVVATLSCWNMRVFRLDPDVFDPKILERLEATAALLSELAVAAEQEAAQATSAKVNAATIEKASLVKGRLQRVLEYQLTDEVSVRELDGIRPGTSYKDLATDLVRLAVLAENHPAEIAGDRHFVATDPADARTLSDAIVADLGTSLAGLETESDDTRARAVTLLINDYAEVLAALNFVGRHELQAEKEKRKPLRAVVQPKRGKAPAPPDPGTPSAPT